MASGVVCLVLGEDGVFNVWYCSQVVAIGIDEYGGVIGIVVGVGGIGFVFVFCNDVVIGFSVFQVKFIFVVRNLNVQGIIFQIGQYYRVVIVNFYGSEIVFVFVGIIKVYQWVWILFWVDEFEFYEQLIVVVNVY